MTNQQWLAKQVAELPPEEVYDILHLILEKGEDSSSSSDTGGFLSPRTPLSSASSFGGYTLKNRTLTE